MKKQARKEMLTRYYSLIEYADHNEISFEKIKEIQKLENILYLKGK